MERWFPSWRAYFRSRHEPLAVFEGWEGLRGVASDRLKIEAVGAGVTPNSGAGRLAGLPIRIPRRRGDWAAHAGTHIAEDWAYAGEFVAKRRTIESREPPPATVFASTPDGRTSWFQIDGFGQVPVSHSGR